MKGHSHGRQKSSGTILRPARKTGQMGRIQQVPLEQRNEPMHGPNRLELGKDSILLSGVLRRADRILLSNAGSILADVRPQDAQISAC